MKATQMKSIFGKVMAMGLVAGALAIAGPAKAEAQQFSIGVQVGRPVVYPDYYARRDYYDHLRWEEARRAEIARQQAWARHQEWLRHEQWEQRGRYEPYPYRYYGR